MGSTDEGELLSDADLKAAEPGALVKLAAAMQALTGVFVALCGLQIVGLRFLRHEFLNALPYVLMLGGVALLVLATRVYRARPWAAFVAAALAPCIAMILMGWIVYSFPQLLSCMVLVSTPCALLSGIVGAFAIGPVRRVAAARARLDAAGMGLGF